MPKIFISYRRKDSAHVSDRIYDIFTEQFGRENILKDIDNIRAGIDFRDEISRLLGECDVVLAVVGPQWVGEDNATNSRRIDEEQDPVRVEIEYVIKRNIPIIPVLCDGMTMEKLVNLPESIATFVYRNGFEVRAGPYFRPDMDVIVRRIKANFQTEADREDQVIQERLAQLEREKKLAEDRRRLEALEVERQQQVEQERIAAIRAEEERKRQEAQEILEQLERDSKEKEAIRRKQQNVVLYPIAAVVMGMAGAIGGFLGDLIWLNAIHSAGGDVVKIGIIVIGAVAGLLIGFVPGIWIGAGLSETWSAALLTAIGVVVGGVFGVLKGATIDQPGGTLLGLGVGIIIGGAVTGFIALAIRKKGQSPWYISKESRVTIPQKVGEKK